MKATQDMLFYGCRSHQVIPYNFKAKGLYDALDPPHFDAVTSLAMLDGYLVSGSRDKMVRVWDHQKMTHLQVEQAHNDFVNVLETDADQKEMYSGSKDGTVKVWRMRQSKLKCMAQIHTNAHSQAINAITRIDVQFGQAFATAGVDKTIKIFKRRQDSLNSINQFDAEELDMLDPFDKAHHIDRNEDFSDDNYQDDMKLLN